MKIPHLYLTGLLIVVMLVSCSSPVRFIDDRVKNNQYMLWEAKKWNNYSTVTRSHRDFFLQFIKLKNSDSIRVNVYSDFLVTEEDYQDTAYLIVNNLIEPVAFKVNKNVNYLENRNTINTTTRTTTDVQTTNTKTTTGNLSAADGDKKVETDVSTATKTKTDTNTQVSSEILNKVNSIRTIIFHDRSKTLLTKSNTLRLRIYTASGDFWDLKFYEQDIRQIRRLATNMYDSVN